MSLPPEKISELKQIIHSQLSQMDVQGHIREALSEVSTSNQENVQQVDLLKALREKGFIDNVMKQLKFDSTASGSASANVLGHHPKPATHFTNPTERVTTAQSVKTANVDPTRRYLFVQILGGKAFLEHLHEPESFPGHATSYLTLHLHFRGQRFKSRPVGCACEPDIQEGFLLELHKDSQGDASRMANATTLLSLCDPVHLVLIKTDQSGDTSIVSSHNMEWRSVLSSPNSRCTTSAELMGIGSENQVPVGLLETKLELIPKLSDSITDDVISAQVGMEKARKAEKERLFLVYAKQWWQEYLQIRSSHKDRLVKIFAQDENGANRPVCSYVKPMRAGRLLDTSRQAARFCSLIGYEKVAMVGGGGKAEQWSAMHTFLSRNKGDCEDHCILLCSLLLGFGLEAYVCIGTKNKGAPHAWVVTLDVDGSATFWESLTGNRYLHRPVNPNDPPSVPQPQNSYPYRTIGCVFNHNAFFGNCQPLDSVELCQFHLRDEALWKAMSEDAIASVCGPGSSALFPQPPPLCANSLDAGLVSNSIEQELRALVTEHRRNQGLSTVWDDHLSYLLTPALAAYETERVTEVSCGNGEFQQAIRRAVPDGHTFKGYPIQFVHCNSRRAFNACLRSNVCEEIINCRGDHVRLAVRAKVFVYPENAIATWIMFAAKYKSVL